MSVSSYIKSNPALKNIAHRMLIPKNEHQPRLWVKLFLNPFKHHRGKNAIIRGSARMDVFPYNDFSIGDKSVIEDFTTINNGVGNVTIGDNSIIGIGSVLIGPVQIGNGVMLAQNIVVSGLNHAYEDVTVSPRLQKETCRQIVINDDVWIGANAVITSGVVLGRHCIIGAGSVVTKSVPEFSVAVGNPAKVIKRYDDASKEWKKVTNP